MNSFLRRSYFDSRSLALYRLTLSLLALAVVCRLCTMQSILSSRSVFTFSDAGLFQLFLVTLTVTALLALLLGYVTRVAAAISWFMLASLVVYKGGDTFAFSVVAQLFIAIFLPLNKAFSVDVALAHGAQPDSSDIQLETSVTIQSIALYVWAVYLLITLAWLLSNCNAVQSGPTVLSMHFLWPLLCIPLVPRQVWDQFRQALIPNRHSLTIYYDEPCGFCRKICFLFRTFLILGDAKIRAAQTQEKVLLIMRQHDSWVVYDAQGRHFIEWSAMLLLMRHSPWLAPLGYFLTWLGMATWGRFVYRSIAYSRNALSNLTGVLLPYKPLPSYTGSWPVLMAAIWFVFALAIPISMIVLNLEIPFLLKQILQYAGGAFYRFP